MALPRVGAFTDSYLPTVNGVTYTVDLWRERFERAGGRMDIVYPASSHTPADGEYPVGSIQVPFESDLRLGWPKIPAGVRDVDIVHAHTPFGLGLAGYRLAKRRSLPLVVSYHTPTPEYAGYLTDTPGLQPAVSASARAYERWFLSRADHVITPSASAAERIESLTDQPVTVLSNGVDTDRFAPAGSAETERLRERLGIPTGPVVGYTGRHGAEKSLATAIDAIAELDSELTLVLAGDGPTRERLRSRANAVGVTAVFPGFLDRSTLPVLYSLLDVFVFPSAVETEGIVALEAMACGTPVVGARAGALPEVIDDGETGYTAQAGDVVAFAATIRRALAERDRLAAAALDRRDALTVDSSIDQLCDLYAECLSDFQSHR